MHITHLLLMLLPFIVGAVPSRAEAGAFSRPEAIGLLQLVSGQDSEPSAMLDEPAGIAGGSRAGKPFTKAGKVTVKQKNATQNGGTTR